MTNNYQAMVRALTRAVERECAAYEEYIALLTGEREAISRFQPDSVSEFTARRQELSDELLALSAERLEICQEISGTEQKRLTDIAEKFLHGSDRTTMLRQAARLRKLVETSQRASQEFSQIVNFSLNLVNGSLSIVMSATRNVVRSYTPYGNIREAFNPAEGSTAGTLARA